jgi:hypothetical protein
MASARRVWALQVAVALLGAAATATALFVAVTRIDFRVPSLAELAAACQRYALPDLRPASVLVLLLGSVALASVTLSVRSVVRQLRAGRRLERGLRLLSPVLDLPRTHVVDDDAPQAFCTGLLRPRIYISGAALVQTTASKLASASSSAWASPTRRSTRRPSCSARRRPIVSICGLSSIPVSVTSAG